MLRSSFLFAWEQYKSWLISPRILLAVYITVFLNQSITVNMLSLCNEAGYVINIAEPLALIFSKSFYTVAIPIVFIALMTDFPRTEGSIFYVYRMSRRSWVVGELLFAVMSSLTYVFSLILGTVLYCMGNCSFDNRWSKYTSDMFIDHPEIYNQNTNLFVNSSVYTQGKPVEVIIHSAVLIFLYVLLLSLIIMLFKLLDMGGTGVMIGGVLTLFGLASDSGASPMMWAFPITHTVFGWHFDAFFRQPFFTLTGSYIYLIALICILLAANLTVSKKARLS